MDIQENANELDKGIRRALRAEEVQPDFGQWQTKYPQALSALQESSPRNPVSLRTQPSILWRRLMKKRYVRYATAAVLLLAVGLGVYLFVSIPNGANIAWAEMAERASNIPTVLCREQTTYERPEGVEEIPGLPDTEATIYISSRYGKRQDVYVNGKLRGNVYFLATKQIMMALDHEEKTYQRIPMTETVFRQMQQVNDPRDMLKKLKTEMSYVSIGGTKINNVEVEGIQIEGKELAPFGDPIFRIWASRKSQLPVQMEFEFTLPLGGKNGVRQKRILKDFQWDVELNETVFTPEIPTGYREVQKRNPDSQAPKKTAKAAAAQK